MHCRINSFLSLVGIASHVVRLFFKDLIAVLITVRLLTPTCCLATICRMMGGTFILVSLSFAIVLIPLKLFDFCHTNIRMIQFHRRRRARRRRHNLQDVVLLALRRKG